MLQVIMSRLFLLDAVWRSLFQSDDETARASSSRGFQLFTKDEEIPRLLLEDLTFRGRQRQRYSLLTHEVDSEVVAYQRFGATCCPIVTFLR